MCGSASTTVAGGAGNSVDFATETRTVQGSGSVGFADDDADRTACGDRGRTVSSVRSAAVRSDCSRR